MSDWKDQLQFLKGKLKIAEPSEARTVTRVDSTLNLKGADAAEIERLVEHFQKVEKWFNHYLKLMGIPLTVSTEAIQRDVRNNGGQSVQYEYIKAWRRYGSQPGFLYENNVKNFVDLLDHVLSTGRSINAIGGAQAGKTNFEVAWMLLGPATFVVTNAAVVAGEIEKPLLYFPIISGPPHKNLGRQSQNAMNNLFKMYGRMKFQALNSSVLGTSALNYFKQFLEIEPSYYEENTLDRSRGEAEIDLPNKFVRRATKASMDNLRVFIQDRVINGLDAEGHARKERDLFQFEFILIVDEAHHGAMDDEERGNVSLLAKLMKEHLVYDGEERSFADIVSDPDTLSRVILASATNWLAENEKLKAEFTEVRLPLGDDYHGPNVFNCNYIDSSRQKGTKPYYGGLCELAKKAQEPFFVHFSPRAYDDVEAFRVIRDGIQEPQWSAISHAEYRELSNKALAKVIRWMTIDGVDASGDCVIRFCNDNALTKAIAGNVQPYLPDVDLKAWTGDKTGTAKEFILEHKKVSQKPIAVLVTGRARMGDDFPRSVRHFVEFAKKITTLSALDQGLCGRASGYGKFWKEVATGYKPAQGIPTRVKDGKLEIGVGNCVWLTDAEAENANAHVASLANPLVTGRKPHAAVKIDGLREIRNSIERQFVGIGYALADNQITAWIDRVNKIVDAMLCHDVRDKQGKYPRRPENFEAAGIISTNRIQYIPIFTDFDPVAYISGKPDLLHRLKSVNDLRIYGPKDAQDGTMTDDGVAAYDVSQNGYARASFEWDNTITSIAVQDHNPGKFGAKDTTTIHLATGSVLGKGVRTRPRGEQKRDSKKRFTELIIKIIRVDADGNIVSEFRTQDRWKVASVIFRCAESKMGDLTVRADINPHKGVTKQFMAAGGE